jgi:hypothetical protein
MQKILLKSSMIFRLRLPRREPTSDMLQSPLVIISGCIKGPGQGSTQAHQAWDRIKTAHSLLHGKSHTNKFRSETHWLLIYSNGGHILITKMYGLNYCSHVTIVG